MISYPQGIQDNVSSMFFKFIYFVLKGFNFSMLQRYKLVRKLTFPDIHHLQNSCTTQVDFHSSEKILKQEAM